jgi:hypothetical protein
MTIRPLEAELIHKDRNITNRFDNCGKAPKKRLNLREKTISSHKTTNKKNL